MIENNTSVAVFFKEAFNLDWKEMNINEEVDVRNYNKKVLSFNEITDKNEFNLITKIIRKEDSKGYSVIQGQNTFNCSSDHKVAMKLHLDKKDFTYATASTLINKQFFSLDTNHNWVKSTVKFEGNIIPILDFEVDKVNNYYSDNILSHNTMFGSPETTPGGNALKFFSSIRIDVRNDGKGDIGEEFGQKTKNIKAKIVKNKVAPPFKIALLTLNTNEEDNIYGFDMYEELLDICVSKGLINKAGSWYSYGEERIGQGKSNSSKWLKNNVPVFEELYKKVLDDIQASQNAVMDSFKEKLAETVAEKKPAKRRDKKDDIPDNVDKETGEIIEPDLVTLDSKNASVDLTT